MSIQKKNNLIGKIIDITDKNNDYYKEYGIITYFDGDYYHIALWCTDLDTAKQYGSIVLSRNEFRVRRKKSV